VVELIGILQQRRYRLGIFTSATRRAATAMLAAAGLERHFHTVICGDEVSAPKPDPLGLQLACRELGVSPAEAAYVGDAEVDLQCAEAAGALGILASWASETRTVPGCRHVALQPGHVSGLLAAPH
jgi:HAD superfamily hydrolase (TIGR01509 family)